MSESEVRDPVWEHERTDEMILELEDEDEDEDQDEVWHLPRE